MELSRSRIIPAPVDMVWAALNDPEMLRGCVPGCDAIQADGENAYRITLAAKVGPVCAKFAGRMRLSDVDSPRGYTLLFEGQGGAAGFAKGEAKVALAPDANGASTVLSYAVNAQVGGKIAQLGSRLVDGAAQKLADDFFGRFAHAVAAKAGVPPAPAVRRGGMPRWQVILLVIIIADIIFWLWTYWGHYRGARCSPRWSRHGAARRGRRARCSPYATMARSKARCRADASKTTSSDACA